MSNEYLEDTCRDIDWCISGLGTKGEVSGVFCWNRDSWDLCYSFKKVHVTIHARQQSVHKFICLAILSYDASLHYSCGMVTVRAEKALAPPFPHHH